MQRRLANSTRATLTKPAMAKGLVKVRGSRLIQMSRATGSAWSPSPAVPHGPGRGGILG